MKTCLVVDDSRMIRRVAGRILTDMQFETKEAENGREAIDYCRSDMPDAILLDWNMPVMDGLSFLKVLRQEPNGHKPVVLFCTAERNIERIAEAIEAGADEYVMKPFDSDIISSKFEMVGLATP